MNGFHPLFSVAFLLLMGLKAVGGTQIYGHRGTGASFFGTRGIFPENSLAAFAMAHTLGLEGAELDVYLSMDEEVVVLHGGEAFDGSIEDTVVIPELSANAFWSIEYLDYKALRQKGKLMLKMPWVRYMAEYVSKNYGMDPVDYLHALSIDETEQLKMQYRQSSLAAPSHSFLGKTLESHLPTLEEVLQTFHGLLKFNVELKGSNAKLSTKVLELAEKYPETINRISSFNWIPPPLDGHHALAPNYSDVNSWPNGKITVDLLTPLINNNQNIPIALLYNSNSVKLPSKSRIIQIQSHFGSPYVHISQQAATVFSDHYKEFVSSLQVHGLKIMAWWETVGFDTIAAMQKQIDAEVDAICPNNIFLAATLLTGTTPNNPDISSPWCDQETVFKSSIVS